MVAYPELFSAQLIVKSLFNPQIIPGGKITVQSEITPANGTWIINTLTYELESTTPHGKWFETMECTQDAPQSQTSSGAH